MSRATRRTTWACCALRRGRRSCSGGLEGDAHPSSELAAHLLGHAACLQRDPAHRVLLHTHATALIAMTRVHPLDARAFSRTLWRMCTECLMFLPRGVAVLPWMPCGTDEIGARTAEALRESALVIWAHHGAFASGSSPDEALAWSRLPTKRRESIWRPRICPSCKRSRTRSCGNWQTRWPCPCVRIICKAHRQDPRFSILKNRGLKCCVCVGGSGRWDAQQAGQVKADDSSVLRSGSVNSVSGR